MVCVLQVIGCVVSLFLMSPKLTGVMCVVIPTIIGFGTFLGSMLRKLSRKAQAQVKQHVYKIIKQFTISLCGMEQFNDINIIILLCILLDCQINSSC